MNNDISLTIRLPIELHDQLTDMTKRLGLTRLSCIRFAIWDFLDKNPKPLKFIPPRNEKTFRFVLTVNENTYGIINKVCKEYDQSINNVIIAVIALAVEDYSKYL